MRRDVSVILPVHVREETPAVASDLLRAIDSVLSQAAPGDLEIVAVDDGSPSPAERLLKGTPFERDPRIRWIRMPINGGLVHALNVGLANARHDLIGRVDADDAWRPGKLERQLAMLEKDSDLTIVATGMRLVHRGRKRDEDLVRPGDWDGILRFFVEIGCPFPHGSIIARREIFELLGGYSHDPNFSHCEDYALWGRWLRFFKPAMIEEVLFDYTVSESSVSGRHASQQRRASGEVQRAFISLAPSRIPGALKELASSCETSLVDAGRLAYRTWALRLPLELPERALGPLRTLLPDRRLHSIAPLERRSSKGPAGERRIRVEIS